MESDQYDRDKATIIENPEITLTFNDYEIYYFYDEMQESKYISSIIEIGDNKYICNVRCENSNH